MEAITINTDESYFVQLPFRQDEYNYEYSVTIGDTTYILWIYFNRRMGTWILNIKDENNDPIVMGIPILVGSQMLSRFADHRIEDMKYTFAFNIKERYAEIGEYDLGSTATVFIAKELT